MEIPKPTETDKERFRALVPSDPRVEVKPMFGNLGAFVNGNLFMGLFGSSIGLKLGTAELAELRALPGVGPFGPRERPMGGYLAVPQELLATPEGARWIGRSIAFVAELPPKAAKSAKR